MLYTLENLPSGITLNSDYYLHHAGPNNYQAIATTDSPEKIHAAITNLLALAANGCTNCTDCLACTNCTNCVDCTNCHDCADCTNCAYCGYCTNCTGCSLCTDCKHCNLTGLLASASKAMPHPIVSIDPTTCPEQLRDPHPNLTPNSVCLHATHNPDAACPALYDYLTDNALQYGYTVTGSYIGAAIIEPIK